MNIAAHNRIRFGDFEFRKDAEQLFRNEALVELQPKPAAILALLLERPGELVTRDEIAQRIWPDRTVDFDQRISTSIKQIRKALGDDSAKPIFVETVPRKGYRFIAPISAIEEYSRVVTGAHGESTGRFAYLQKSHMLVAALIVFGFIVAAIVVFAMREDTSISNPTAANDYSPKLLLVLSGDTDNEEQASLTAGLTDDIIARLSRIRPQTLGVIARTTAAQFNSSAQSLERAQRDLSVDYAVRVVVQDQAQDRQVAIELIRLRDQTQMWSQTYDLASGDWAPVREEVAANIAQMLNLRLSHAISKDRASEIVNSQAFDNYLTGRAYLNRFGNEGREKAIEYFERAIAADANFAPAYAALASIYRNSTKQLEQARIAVDRALMLDPELSEAHEVNGRILLYNDKNLTGAKAAFERAIELEPGRASARLGYATYLSAIGDFDAAIDEAAVARMLDPLSGSVFGEIGWFYLHANQAEAAVPVCSRALALNQGNAYYGLIANDCLVLAYRMLNNIEAAVAPAMRVMELYGDGDPREEEIKLAGSVDEKMRIYWSWRIDAMSKFAANVDIAKAHVALGDYENALKSLRKALEKNAGGLVFIKTDPSWAPLRGDPEFEEIVLSVFHAERS